MALMKFREPNQVLWRGVRPAHDGTQVTETRTAVDNVQTIDIVGAGQIFYLCAVTHSIYTVAAGLVYCRIYTDALVNIYSVIDRRILDTSDGLWGHATFWPPMELLEDYTIRFGSTAAGLTIIGSVFGWIE